MKQVITEAKRKKIAKALHDTGTISKIKYIAVGSGGVDENNEVLSPSETATALKHELLRKEYTSSQKISDTCYEYTLVIEANELVGEYISEIALIDEDNDILQSLTSFQKVKTRWKILSQFRICIKETVGYGETNRRIIFLLLITILVQLAFLLLCSLYT